MHVYYNSLFLLNKVYVSPTSYYLRNLLCVYSKNHIYDVPELAEMKKRANTRSLKEMVMLLRYRYHCYSSIDVCVAYF